MIHCPRFERVTRTRIRPCALSHGHLGRCSFEPPPAMVRCESCGVLRSEDVWHEPEECIAHLRAAVERLLGG